MAIDTPAKRKSCIGLALLALRCGVIPTGSSLSAAERLHTNGLYSGISAQSITLYNPDIELTAAINRTISLTGVINRTIAQESELT